MTAPLSAREGYRLWAPTYQQETVVTALEDRGVRDFTPTLAGRALLDAGCGTGRRLRTSAGTARLAVGADLVPEMLAAGRAEPGAPPTAAADLRALPFTAGRFDVLWCRLALGHLAVLDRAYDELRRVAGAGARLVVSDFHPEAAAAGHTRSFRDGNGRLRTLAHHAHGVEDHRRAAGAAGWRLEDVADLCPGRGERPYYERAGRLDAWEAHRNLPLVLVLGLRC